MTKIYVLIDPRTEEIRYVGKTSAKLSRRLSQHTRARAHNRHDAWVTCLRERDLRPHIELVQEVPDDFWQEAERYWIAYYRSIGCNLVNGTDGGEGAPKGIKLTPEHCAKISASGRGRKHHAFSRTTLTLMSAAQRRRYENPTERENASARAKARFNDSTERAKMSAAAKRHYENPIKQQERAS